jgi:hypothetical protein
VAGIGSRGETLLDHGVYITSGSKDWELAYNLIENITGGNGIQLYGPGHLTSTINNVNVHHNWIHDVNKHGLNISDNSGTGILIWSNVVYNTVGGCWRNNSVHLQSARIWNNTFYNCNTDNSYPSGAALMNDVENPQAPITADFRNNIIWSSAASARYTGGETGFAAEGVRITGTRDLWFGGHNPDSTGFEVNAVFANPLFVNADRMAPNFHLQGPSPAAFSGDLTVVPIVSSGCDFTPIAVGTRTINRGAC